MQAHPVGIEVRGTLRRNRLTVFFRLLLAIPHFFWFALWSLAVVVGVIVGWFVALATARLPRGLHGFFSSYIRYSSQLLAYLSFIADPYPPFDGSSLQYPIQLTLPERDKLSRRKVLLRIVLALPALVFTTALGGGGGGYIASGRDAKGLGASWGSGGILSVAFILGWFSGVFRGRMTSGLRDAGAYAIGYRAQTLAYVLLLTDRYPNADPTELLGHFERPPLHPVRLVGDAHDLRRSRVTAFFRLALAIPHLVWLWLWGFVAMFVVVIQWFVVLFAGRPAKSLHRFLTRFVRYGFHVYSFLLLVANTRSCFSSRTRSRASSVRKAATQSTSSSQASKSRSASARSSASGSPSRPCLSRLR